MLLTGAAANHHTLNMVAISIDNWELGRDLRFRYLNYNAEITGDPPQSVIGMTIWEAAGGSLSDPKWLANCIAMGCQEEFQGFTCELVRPGGRFLFVVDGWPIWRHGDGRWAGVRGRSVATPLVGSIAQALARVHTWRRLTANRAG